MDLERYTEPKTIAAIWANYEAKRKSEHRPHLGGSQIGNPCERALFYQFRHAARPHFEGRTLRLFERGDREEPVIVSNLRAVGATVWETDPDTGKQISFSAHGGHFSLSLDGVAEGLPDAPKTVHTLEFKTMNDKSIVFAMANPVPEIMYEEAKEKGVYIYGSGRSDMPNQVNNSSVFPGLFRGALDVRARQINEEMKLAAAHALADLAIHSGKLDPDHVVVDVFDPQVPFAVAKAVAKAAIASGVARATELPEKYRD